MTDPNVFKEKTAKWISLNKKALSKLEEQFGKGQVGNLLGSIKVYEDDKLEDDKILVGYRGPEFFEAGLVYYPHSDMSVSTAPHFVEVLREAGITTIGEDDE
jgi:hypothetical protein